MSSTRSPSPITARPANPNLRSSESNSSIRRSFSGNPFARPSLLTNPRSSMPSTPANSPAEFGRKQIGGKDGFVRGFEEKENEKDCNSKGVKFKSPSKGSKNFMSPTISAASKFTPSPRKKILGEVNEAVQTSVSFADGRVGSAENLISKSGMVVDQNKAEGSYDDSNLPDLDKKKVVPEAPTVPKASKRVTFCEVPLNSNNDSESLSDISSDPDCVILGDPLIHETSDRDAFSPLPLNFDNDSEPLSEMTMNSNCVNSESISSHMFYSTSPEVLSIPKASNGEHTPLCSGNKSETVSDITMSSDSVHVELSSKSESYSSPMIAPLDADPSFPPYDPKTNYLSPRPKFLRYKPNPRIEVLLNKGKGHGIDSGKGLEESFVISDTSSDTDVTEETHSRDSSQKESDDGSADMTTSEEEQEESLVSEQIPISSHLPEKTSEVKRASNWRFFTVSKCFSLALLLLIACASISVTDIPVLDSQLLKDSSFYKFYASSEVAVFARVTFDEFARNLGVWSSQMISCLSEKIAHFVKVNHFDTIQYSNLTIFEEIPLVDGFLGFSPNSLKREEIFEDDEFESVEEREAEIGPVEEKTTEHNEGEIEEVLPAVLVKSNGYQNSVDMVDNEQNGVPTAQVDAEPQSNVELEDQMVLTPHASEFRPEIESTEINQEVAMEFQVDNNERSGVATVHVNAELDAEPQSNVELEDDQMVVTPQASEFRPEIKPSKINQEVAMEFQGDSDVSSSRVESFVVDENPTYSSVMAIQEIVGEAPIHLAKDNWVARVMLGIAVVATAAITFTYVKKQGKNSSTTTNNAVNVDTELSKKMIFSSPISKGHKYLDSPFSQNWPTEFDVTGESSSYPSEMSSFQKSTSKGAFKETNKAQSQERRSRKSADRESLASSEYSMGGSPSYGSFTTYERIPVKHAYGEEEIVTPVRRSSRIRSQVISP